MNDALLHAKVLDDENLLPFALLLELRVTDRDLIQELAVHPEGAPRDEYALCALRIGLLALKQARGQIDADAVRRESERLMVDLEAALDRHKNDLHQNLESRLKEYFDPNSGRFHDRIERLLRKDGDLERFLGQQIGSKDSELCRTLAAHVGENSPLMKLLNPAEAAGLVQTFTTSLAKELQGSRDTILREFSLNHEESALNRLVKKLKDEHGELSSNFHSKIDSVVKEFDLNAEESALSRLVRRVETAQTTITTEFSLDSDTSALARLKRELTNLLTDHAAAVQKFQQEMRESLESMKTWRAAAARTTLHGLEFERVVFDFVQRECQPAGEVTTFTADTVGEIKSCKVGDVVIELGSEHIAAGARIVVEAKDKKGYTLREAREEIEQARKNRAAAVGLFLFSKKTAPDGLEPFQRLGEDVFVVWDGDDPQSDVYLRAGVMVARALCSRQAKQRLTSAADFNGIDKAILDIEKKTQSLDEIRDAAGTINNQTEKILKRVRIAREGIEEQLDGLRELLGGLKAAFQESERGSPSM
jgi:hypothetical protein